MNDDLKSLVESELSAEQRTAAWLYERVGHCTASRFKDATAKIGKGEAAARRNYRVQLAVERLINAPTANFVNSAMQWGIDQELQARMEYEAKTGAIVLESGFIHHATLQWCGGSPDGLIGKHGGVEFKCPFEPAVHVTTMMTGECEHLPQIQGLMWITGRKWWDFVSYDPRMPAGLQLYVKRIERDDKYIAALESDITAFLKEVNDQHVALMAMRDAYLAPKAAPQTPAPVPVGPSEHPAPSLAASTSAGAAANAATSECLAILAAIDLAKGRADLEALQPRITALQDDTEREECTNAYNFQVKELKRLAGLKTGAKTSKSANPGLADIPNNLPFKPTQTEIL